MTERLTFYSFYYKKVEFEQFYTIISACFELQRHVGRGDCIIKKGYQKVFKKEKKQQHIFIIGKYVVLHCFCLLSKYVRPIVNSNRADTEGFVLGWILRNR